jgi:hypothetical protein
MKTRKLFNFTRFHFLLFFREAWTYFMANVWIGVVHLIKNISKIKAVIVDYMSAGMPT